MPETRATRYVGHGRWECLHGLLIQQCRCMHPEFATRIVYTNGATMATPVAS
jgi:hypothetical protein